jgi:hypothetical protein
VGMRRGAPGDEVLPRVRHLIGGPRRMRLGYAREKA